MPRLSPWALLPLTGFVYLLQRPVSHGNVLLPDLLFLALCGLAAFLFGRDHSFPGPLAVLMLIEVLFGAVFLLLGDGNPGRADQALTYLGFPIVYWLIVAGMTERMLRAVLTALAVGSIMAAVTIILYIGQQQGVLPVILPTGLLIDQSGAFFTDNAFTGVGIHLYALGTMVAAAPLWLASVFVPDPKWMPSAKWRLTAAVLCATAAAVSGRKAIVVTVVLAPLLLWIVSLVIGRRAAERGTIPDVERVASRRRRSVLVAAALLGVFVVGQFAFSSSTLSTRVITSDFQEIGPSFFGGTTGSADAVIRAEESTQLLTAWHQHPLLGNGFGAVIPGYARNNVKPWDFELQYHLLLFTTGIAGVLFAVAALLAFVRVCRRAVRNRPDLAGTLAVTLTGMLALLLAAASNPYLQAPGYYWGLFLPVAVTKVMLSGAAPRKRRRPTYRKPVAGRLPDRYRRPVASRPVRRHPARVRV